MITCVLGARVGCSSWLVALEPSVPVTSLAFRAVGGDACAWAGSGGWWLPSGLAQWAALGCWGVLRIRLGKSASFTSVVGIIT